jgi:hypothetical protein
VDAVRTLCADADAHVASVARWATERLSKDAAAERAAGTIPATLWKPYLPRQALGIMAYPGDVMDLAVSGTWRIAGAAVKPTVAQTVRPEMPRVAAFVTVSWWQGRLGMGPQLVPVAGEVSLSPLEMDALTDAQDMLETLDGEVRVTDERAR